MRQVWNPIEGRWIVPHGLGMVHVRETDVDLERFALVTFDLHRGEYLPLRWFDNRATAERIWGMFNMGALSFEDVISIQE